MYAADVVYVNNAWYDEVITAKPAGVKVFNVLDLAPHIADFPVAKLKAQLAHADIITSISETVRVDLLKRTEYNSTIIYQPIQKIFRKNEKKYPHFKYMFCGRVQDPNKRARLGLDALNMLGVSWNNVLTTGTEFHGFGAYVGLLDEEQLNDVFNSVEYVIFPSREEGIGLPAIEAIAAGAIPVLCYDLSTLKEFFPFPEYDSVCASAECIARFISQFEDNPDCKQAFREKLYTHYKQNLEQKFSINEVASKILDLVGEHRLINIK